MLGTFTLALGWISMVSHFPPCFPARHFPEIDIKIAFKSALPTAVEACSIQPVCAPGGFFTRSEN
jgi:hypothetical protein